MAIKKYLSLERLTEYDALIKQEIANSVSGKANSSHTHDDRYYTETEVDSKFSAVNTSISNITGGTTVVKKAEQATKADSATTASTAGKLTNPVTISLAGDATGSASFDGSEDVNITVTIKDDSHSHIISDIDNLRSELDGKASSTHNHDDDYDEKGAAASALTSANTYADSAAAAAAAAVKSDLLNGAGGAYDTLKELGDLIDDNKDAIDALETVASGKADAEHGHEISDVSGLQSALDGKAASSHGTHVTYSTTAPVMDGTASVGTAATVARSDHKHPTDTSRASKTEFDTHVADTAKHITSTERTNWGAAYTHSQAAHAPSDAEKNQNAFSNVKVGSTTVSADTTTDTLEIAAGAGISVAGDATNDKVTITNSGVISVATGSANGTISVNTNGTSANVAVKGLGSAAYTNSSAYATADHTHTVDSSLSSSSANPVQNKVVNSAITTLTSAVSANTNSINSHSEVIGQLQTAVSEIQEITSQEIQDLFA